jgi:hypothetical protein
MKKIIFLFLFVPSLSFALSCEKAEKLGEYMSMNGKGFIEKYKAHKIKIQEEKKKFPNKKIKDSELTLELDDVNQARKAAYNLPALQDLGFPPVGKNWEPFVVKMESSSLKDLRSGWQYRNANGDVARVRLDFDPEKGGHYNIEVFKKGSNGKEPAKLAVTFNCNGKPCTGDQVKKMAKGFN